MNLDYLLNASEPWVVYRTLLDLIDKPESDAAVTKARFDMLRHPLVVQLLAELQQWPGKVLNSHKSAGQLYHKLSFALDIGLSVAGDDLRSVVQKMTENRSEEGLPQLPASVSAAHGGSGQTAWAWALCDAPLLLGALFRLRLKDERLTDILMTIRSKENPDGCYTPESVWQAWRGWDFAQKTAPSPWLTFLVYRIFKRSGYAF